MHLVLHVIVPIVVALAFYRPAWRSAAIVMLATMIVDADHLLADPIYDPERCSIGFHPLHSTLAIAAWAALFAGAAVARRRPRFRRWTRGLRIAELVGLGLLIHMALDALDCLA